MRMTRASYNRLRRKVARATGKKLPVAPRGPNVNEQRFNRLILAGHGNFEPPKVEITNSGKVYTPDFCYAGPNLGKGSRIVMIEVKGTYRSKKDEKLICERSRLAWEVAGDRHPEVDWVWAKYQRGGYLCELRTDETERITAFCRNNQDFENLLKGRVK